MSEPLCPVFSIVIPAFNAEATIARAIESVLAQQFADFEIIVVDDGSTDSTAEIVAAYAQKDSRVVLASRENGGTGAAYNTGSEVAHGQWIVMLSADDMLATGHLSAMALAIRENPDAALFSTNGWYLYDNGRRVLAYLNEPSFGTLSCTLAQLFDRCFFPVGATFSREACLAVGGFASDLYAEDYYLFLRLLASGYTHHYIDAPLAVHARNRRQKSAAGLTMREGDLATIERVIKDFELSAVDLAAAQSSIERLQININRRRKLYKIFGPSFGEFIITVARQIRP